MKNNLFVIDTNTLISASLFRNTVPGKALRKVNETIAECRDLKDNKFLELAVTANASCIISGDKDLLVLHPFRGIPIVNPADFLNKF